MIQVGLRGVLVREMTIRISSVVADQRTNTTTPSLSIGKSIILGCDDEGTSGAPTSVSRGESPVRRRSTFGTVSDPPHRRTAERALPQVEYRRGFQPGKLASMHSRLFEYISGAGFPTKRRDEVVGIAKRPPLADSTISLPVQLDTLVEFWPQVMGVTSSTAPQHPGRRGGSARSPERGGAVEQTPPPTCCGRFATSATSPLYCIGNILVGCGQGPRMAPTPFSHETPIGPHFWATHAPRSVGEGQRWQGKRLSVFGGSPASLGINSAQ